MELSVFYPNVMQYANQSGLSIPETLKMVHGMGISKVYMCYREIDGKEKEMLEILKEAEMSISGFFDFYDFGSNPEDDSWKKVVDFASEHGIKDFLVVPGMVPMDDEEKKLLGMNNMVTTLNRICDYAKGKGVQIEMEDSDGNMPYCTDDDLVWFLERVPGLKICFDTGNFIFGYADTLKAFERLKPHICNMHLKDRSLQGIKPNAVRNDGSELYCAPVGHGIIPIKEIIDNLKDMNYSGNLNIELFGASDMKAYIEKSADWLIKYWE